MGMGATHTTAIVVQLHTFSPALANDLVKGSPELFSPIMISPSRSFSFRGTHSVSCVQDQNMVLAANAQFVL